MENIKCMFSRAISKYIITRMIRRGNMKLMYEVVCSSFSSVI